uniref:Uncharacterized protein n=1 Tax=Globodera rostochiensis TaxID=31243 RepID=A0A914HPN4_GLORO
MAWHRDTQTCLFFATKTARASGTDGTRAESKKIGGKRKQYGNNQKDSSDELVPVYGSEAAAAVAVRLNTTGGIHYFPFLPAVHNHVGSGRSGNRVDSLTMMND